MLLLKEFDNDGMLPREMQAEVKNFLEIKKAKILLFIVFFLIIPYPIFFTFSHAVMPFFGIFSLYLLAAIILSGVPSGMNTVAFVQTIMLNLIISLIFAFSII